MSGRHPAISSTPCARKSCRNSQGELLRSSQAACTVGAQQAPATWHMKCAASEASGIAVLHRRAPCSQVPDAAGVRRRLQRVVRPQQRRAAGGAAGQRCFEAQQFLLRCNHSFGPPRDGISDGQDGLPHGCSAPCERGAASCVDHARPRCITVDTFCLTVYVRWIIFLLWLRMHAHGSALHVAPPMHVCSDCRQTSGWAVRGTCGWRELCVPPRMILFGDAQFLDSTISDIQRCPRPCVLWRCGRW